MFDFNLLKVKNEVFLAFNNTSDANTECIDVVKHNIYSFWEQKKYPEKNLANKIIFKKREDFPTYYPIFLGMKPETNKLIFFTKMYYENRPCWTKT